MCLSRSSVQYQLHLYLHCLDMKGNFGHAPSEARVCDEYQQLTGSCLHVHVLSDHLVSSC